MFDEEERQIYETKMQSSADVESKITSAVEKGLSQGKEQGRREGRTEGMTEGMVRSLLTVLTAKFGELPDKVRARIEGADCGQLEEWMDRVFAAERPEDLFREALDN